MSDSVKCAQAQETKKLVVRLVLFFLVVGRQMGELGGQAGDGCVHLVAMCKQHGRNRQNNRLRARAHTHEHTIRATFHNSLELTRRSFLQIVRTA